MGRRKYDTTITDDYGIPHEYKMTQHGAMAGSRLFNRVFGLTSPVIVRIVRALGGGTGVNPFDVDWKEKGLSAFMDGGFDGLADGLEGFSDALREHGTPELYLEILKNVSRDFREESTLTPESSKPDWRFMKNMDDFDEAYAGNLGEMFSAVYWVISRNFAPLFSARLRKLGINPSDLRRQWKSISDQLQNPSTASPESGESSSKESQP